MSSLKAEFTYRSKQGTIHSNSGMIPSALLNIPQHSGHRVRVFGYQNSDVSKRADWRQKAEGKSNDALSERLKAAESEATELRKQLEAARATKAKDVSSH